MKLTTRYLGLTLAHPFMPGASPLVDCIDTVLQLEDAGASAIVMHSLFEEQISRERFRHELATVHLRHGGSLHWTTRMCSPGEADLEHFPLKRHLCGPHGTRGRARVDHVAR